LSAHLGFTTDSFFLFFVSCYPPSSLNGTQPNRPHGRKWLRLENACPKSGCTIPLQIGGSKPPFSTSQLNDNFSDLYLRNETWYRQSVRALTTNRGLLYCPKTIWTLVHKRLKMGPAFYPPFINSAFQFIARLRRRRSANRTQPNFGKRWTVVDSFYPPSLFCSVPFSKRR